MTIISYYEPIIYKANGVATQFIIPWKFFKEEVIVKDEFGVVYPKYTIINSGDGGTVIFDEAPRGKVVISRYIPLNQEVAFIEGENFPAEDYEYSLDRIYMILQKHHSELLKSIRVPEQYANFDAFLYDLVRTNSSDEGLWSSTVNYQKGMICKYNQTLYYRYSNAENKGVSPEDDSTGWTVLANFSDLNNYYTKVETDKLITDLDSSIKSYVDNKIGDIDSILDFINGEVI